MQSWLVVAAVMLVMYLLIFGVVRRGSQTIDAQRRQLDDKVMELSVLATQNAHLHDKVRRAAVRTSELNERFCGVSRRTCTTGRDRISVSR